MSVPLLQRTEYEARMVPLQDTALRRGPTPQLRILRISSSRTLVECAPLRDSKARFGNPFAGAFAARAMNPPPYADILAHVLTGGKPRESRRTKQAAERVRGLARP